MGKFQPRTMKVTLYQGDWQDRVDKARRAAEVADRSKGSEVRTMGEEPEHIRLAREHDAIKAEAEAEGAVVVTIQAVHRNAWSELLESNPPRTGEEYPEHVREGDAALGVNDTALGEALVPKSIAAISDPDMTVDDLLDGISSAQFDLLYGAAFALNRGTGSDPKDAPSLTPSLSSGATEN